MGKRKQFAFNIDEELHKQFAIKAIQEGETKTNLLIKWIKEFIQKDKK
ncbi:hypothetical protein J4419_05025 [Candidatus Woesearchaeota archaeon]|nr:hypothetical protein [Candidatus Woesearchaeota archaeon]